jgi:hypothetical protein
LRKPLDRYDDMRIELRCRRIHQRIDDRVELGAEQFLQLAGKLSLTVPKAPPCAPLIIQLDRDGLAERADRRYGINRMQRNVLPPLAMGDAELAQAEQRFVRLRRRGCGKVHRDLLRIAHWRRAGKPARPAESIR